MVRVDEQQVDASDRWVRIGGIVFLVGVVAVLAAVLPFFFGVRNWPLALNLVAGLMPPLGVAISLWGLLRAARKARANRPHPVG